MWNRNSGLGAVYWISPCDVLSHPFTVKINVVEVIDQDGVCFSQNSKERVLFQIVIAFRSHSGNFVDISVINLDREKDFLRGLSKFIREGVTSPAPETYKEIMEARKKPYFWNEYTR